MRKIPIILTLILTAVWGYTSWYWYVCSIKGLCNTSQSEVFQNNNKVSYSDVVSNLDIQNETETGVIVTGSLLNTTKLSTEDVLRDNPKIQKEEVPEAESTGSTVTKENIDISIQVLSGSTVENQGTLCQNPIVGPIGLGAQNRKDEVLHLEAFLIARGEKITADGIYGQDDFEAIKRFQLEFRADILDPWDITAPTGYVYKTTVKKINEVACQ